LRCDECEVNVATHVIKTYRGSGGETLHYRWFEAASPRGLLVCLHGIQSHGGWYETGAEYYARRGYSTMLLDRRGSGLNTANPGHAGKVRVLVEDIDAAIEQEARSGVPVILMGISWGGKLATVYALERDGALSGLVLSAPGIAVKLSAGVVARMKVAAAAFFSPGKMFAVPIPDGSYFTGNADRQKFIDEDPLSTRQVTARFLGVSQLMTDKLRNAGGRLATPTLLILAGRDRIVDNAKMRRFYDSLGCRKKLHVFEDAHHTLEFEPETKAYFDLVCDWMDDVAE